MLDKMVEKARKGLVNVKEFAAGEHEISVSEERLNRMAKEDETVRKKLDEAGVDDVELAVEDARIVVRGRFRKKGVSGGFRVRMKPGEPIWEEDRHAIRFDIVDQDVDFDRNVSGLIAGLGSKVAAGLFGWDVVGGRIREETEGGVVTLDLDGHGRLLDTVLTSIRATRLECRPGRVVFAFKPDGAHAMSNARDLLTWWRERKGETDTSRNL